jgi:hypothetical protein
VNIGRLLTWNGDQHRTEKIQRSDALNLTHKVETGKSLENTKQSIMKAFAAELTEPHNPKLGK